MESAAAHARTDVGIVRTVDGTSETRGSTIERRSGARSGHQAQEKVPSTIEAPRRTLSNRRATSGLETDAEQST